MAELVLQVTNDPGDLPEAMMKALDEVRDALQEIGLKHDLSLAQLSGIAMTLFCEIALVDKGKSVLMPLSIAALTAAKDHLEKMAEKVAKAEAH